MASDRARWHLGSFARCTAGPATLSATLALTLFALASEDAGAATRTAPTCIVGRVVAGDSERPISDALVVTSRAGRALDRVMTDSAGAFLVTGLSSGRYQVAASHPAYVSVPADQAIQSTSMLPVDLRETCAAPLVLRLWPIAAISGVVLDASTSEPVSRVGIRAYRRQVVAGVAALTEVAHVVTDDRGAYTFDGLLAGSYVIGHVPVYTTTPAALADTAARDMTVPWLGDLLSLGDAATRTSGISIGTMLLAAGPETSLLSIADGVLHVYGPMFVPSGGGDQFLTLAAGERRDGVVVHLRAVPTRSISGTLRLPSGSPSGFTPVRLLRTTVRDIPFEVPIAAGISDGQGAFTLVGVPEGDFVLRVSRRPVSRAAAPAAQIDLNDAGIWASHALAVGNADFTGLDIDVGPGTRLSGQLRFEGAAPAGLEQTLVRIQPLDGLLVPPGWLVVRLRADGAFTFAGLPRGRYVIAGVDNLPPGWVVGGVTRDGRDVSDTAIALGDEAGDVEIVVTNAAGGVAGTVRARNNSPLREATVLCFPVARQQWTAGPAASRRFAAIGTDSTGRFEAQLPAGDYYAVAVYGAVTADWQTTDVLSRLTGAATRVRVPATGRFILDLTAVEMRR